MSDLRPQPLSEREAAFHLSLHIGSSSTNEPQLRRCVACGEPLHKKSKLNIHLVCRKLRGLGRYPEKTSKSRFYGRDPFNGYYVPEVGNEVPSSVPATRLDARTLAKIRCKVCRRHVFKLTCPVTPPFQTVAVTCATCGDVAGYLDDVRQGLTELEAERVKDFETAPRDYVVRRGVAHQANTALTLAEKAAIVQLQNGVAAKRVAAHTGLTLAVTRALAKNYPARRAN